MMSCNKVSYLYFTAQTCPLCTLILNFSVDIVIISVKGQIAPGYDGKFEKMVVLMV